MDHKAWSWRKKSTEKTIVAAEKGNLSLKANEEEVQSLLTDKAELEKELKILNDKLSSTLSECNSKDDLVKKHAKMAQEAIAGWEKAEAEAVSLKQKLDAALQQRVASEERLTHLDDALKECMQQLRFVREEQEQRIHDAVMKTSREFEKTQMVLEEKLAETSKRLSKLGVENTQFSKALLVKDKMIEDLNEHKTRVEADFNALMTRLDSTEKDNASLKYEVRVLEKELEIRNEEREFNRRTADVSHKQHLERVKKIAKLDSECQRLRLLVRKRLPGPAALAKMKNEVEMLGKDSAEMRRRKLNPSPTDLMVDFAADNSPDTPSKKINVLTEQLCGMEEENKILKETLGKKVNELQFSRIMYARTASKLSQVEAHLEESSKGRTTAEPTRNSLVSRELSLASMSDIGSDDKVSCAESWASALISELEHFKNGKQNGAPSCKSVAVSDINLMDDFVEMEKLAIVSVDQPFGSSNVSSHKVNGIVAPLKTESSRYSSEVKGREIVPVSDCQSQFNVLNQEIQSKDVVVHKVPDWLQDILKVILEQNRVTQRNPDEILEDIRVAMAYINNPNPGEFLDARESSTHPGALNRPDVSGYISWPDKSSVMDSSNRVANVDCTLIEKGNQQFQSNLSKSICKIIELIEGISLPSPDHDTPETFSGKDVSFFTHSNSETPAGYMVRVFQWKTSELSAVLQQFLHTCHNLLSGKADLEKFACESTSALDWIMNHCFSLQDVSSMRDNIKKHFGWDDTRSESEVEVGVISQYSEAGKFRVAKERLCLPTFAALNGHNNFLRTGEFPPNVKEENRRLKDELMNKESTKKDLEGKLHSAIDQSESLMNQLQESENTIAGLQTELESLKESKGVIEERVENHKLMDEDLDTQLTVATVELNDTRQKLSYLEVELENKNNCCEELEATCLELQLQLESIMKKDIPSYDMDRDEKQLRSDWEITAASEKLAECQETILNLGKQLKALASPREAALFDKVVTSPSVTTMTTTAVTPKKKNMNQQRSSLLDRMLAEDDAETMDPKSPKTKEIICTSNLQKPPTFLDGNSNSAFGPDAAIEPPESFLGLEGIKPRDLEAAVDSWAIVPSKKRGSGGLLRKLLWRRKKGNSKKTTLPFAKQI